MVNLWDLPCPFPKEGAVIVHHQGGSELQLSQSINQGLVKRSYSPVRGSRHWGGGQLCKVLGSSEEPGLEVFPELEQCRALFGPLCLACKSVIWCTCKGLSLWMGPCTRGTHFTFCVHRLVYFTAANAAGLLTFQRTNWKYCAMSQSTSEVTT